MAKAPTTIPAPPPPPAPVAAVPPPPPAPPVDNENVEPGATPFTPAEVEANADPHVQAGATNANEVESAVKPTDPKEQEAGTLGADVGNTAAPIADQLDPNGNAPSTGVPHIGSGRPTDALPDETPQEYYARKDREAAEADTFDPKNALAQGGVKAADYKAPDPDIDDEFAEVPEDKWGKRSTKISNAAFKAGRNGARLGKKRKSMTDAEWDVYQAAYARGVAQGDADELSDEERFVRVEKALGLPIPGAADPGGEDDE